MSVSSAQLSELIAQLHQVNDELSEAARPLRERQELNEDQREHIGAQIRARLARWEYITACIGKALNGSPTGSGEMR